MARVQLDGVELDYTDTGHGPTVVLLHGFPHTRAIWRDIVTDLAADHRVVAPDLRGYGASSLTVDGADAGTVSVDVEGLLTELGVPEVTLVAIDAGAPPAFLLALRRPDLLAHLVLVESTLGRLPGAEQFTAAGPPWWFGFHAVPGFAERVLAGHEAEYVGWFYDQGTRGHGTRPDLRAELGAAFGRPGALAAALAYYRALPVSAAQIAEATAGTRLTVPTTAVGAAPVGSALEQQLRPLTDDLRSHLLDDCGHIVPVDRPAALAGIIRAATRPPSTDRPAP